MKSCLLIIVEIIVKISVRVMRVVMMIHNTMSSDVISFHFLHWNLNVNCIL